MTKFKKLKIAIKLAGIAQKNDRAAREREILNLAYFIGGEDMKGEIISILKTTTPDAGNENTSSVKWSDYSMKDDET